MKLVRDSRLPGNRLLEWRSEGVAAGDGEALRPILAATRKMRCARIQFLLVWGQVLFLAGGAWAEALPPLAELKAAAERGDPKSQSRLGDLYSSSLDFAHAGVWYANAAVQGDAHAQYRLGWFYETAPKSIGADVRDLPHIEKDPREAVKWYLAAATQGDATAQEKLGHLYQDGQILKQDRSEAYKWFTLAAKQHTIVPAVYRDQLILKMSQLEIEEGQRRADAFRPGRIVITQLPDPPLASKLKLGGISTFGTNRVATINGVNFQTGMTANAVVGGRFRRVKCLEIRKTSVVVEVEGMDGTAEVR